MKIARFETIVCGWADDVPDVLDIIDDYRKVGTGRRKDEYVDNAVVSTPFGADTVSGRVLAEITVQEMYADCDFWVTMCFDSDTSSLRYVISPEEY